MSKKYGFSVRLAAVAFVIAGVLGTVWAAPNFASGSVVAEFSFDNPFTGTISWAKGPFTDGKTVGSVDVVDSTGFRSGDIGNVGVLAINTNGNHWDVKMTSKYGGRLFTDGGDTTILDKYPAGCDNFLKPCTATVVQKAGQGLKYSGLGTLPRTGGDQDSSVWWTETDTLVVLDVAIGQAMQAVTGNFFSVGCTSSSGQVSCTNSPAPIRLGKKNILRSGTIIDTAGAQGKGEGLGVSFADAIKDNATMLSGLGKGPFLGVTANAANFMDTDLQNGFKGTGSDQFIYINVGIHEDNSSAIVADGTLTYKETFTFTLYNGY